MRGAVRLLVLIRELFLIIRIISDTTQKQR